MVSLRIRKVKIGFADRSWSWIVVMTLVDLGGKKQEKRRAKRLWLEGKQASQNTRHRQSDFIHSPADRVVGSHGQGFTVLAHCDVLLYLQRDRILTSRRCVGSVLSAHFVI